ncbi:hypothetical protein DSO57_1006060 [Entomophthora muscae]|uniref:Uncharacterized protein n=1 Tax=Entomophthora muscae TaxID=34485 RepID=A0ACC2U6C2_9FUNG|nr:hypothetical protein DSO57_1006060 [Entomophthora muscae]
MLSFKRNIPDSNIFNSASKQASSSQGSFCGGEAHNVEAPVYIQVFDADNKEADLYLTPSPYGFDLFESHLVSCSAPAPLPIPTQAANQLDNQNDNPALEQLSASSHPPPLQPIWLQLLWPSPPNTE